MRTYVVRLADLAPTPPEQTGPATAEPRLRGVVDDVRTGERTPFRSTEELLSVLVDSPGEQR